MPLPKPYYDHYPYEKLTDKETANIARLQDKHITDLQHENRCLKDELYAVNQWRKRVIPILEANGIDLDAIESIMAETDAVFS